MERTIRKVLADRGQLEDKASELSELADLYRAGLTSHGMINVMLGLEDELDMEFPDRLLRKDTFRTVRTIMDAVTEVRSRFMVAS